MNTKQTLVTIFTAIGIGIAGTWGTKPAHTETASSSLLHVEMSLASTNTPAPGQPIILRYSVINTSTSETVRFFVGDHEDGWYKVSLVDAGGQSALPLPIPRPSLRRQGGLYQPPEKTLQPGQRLQGTIVVTRLFQELHPGKYDLGINVRLIGLASADATEQESGQGVPAETSLLVSEKFTFPVAVAPNNPMAIHKMAEDLRRRLMRPDAEDRKTLIQELFSVPEAAALSSWRTLVSDPAASTFTLADAAEELSYHPSVATAELLGQIIWRDENSTDAPSEAQNAQAWAALAKMYAAAGPALKQRMKSMYLSHGISASELEGEHVKSQPN